MVKATDNTLSTAEAARPWLAVPFRLRDQAWKLTRDPTARKGVLSVGGQAVISATSFFTAVLIGRACSKEELGVYALALSIVLFLRAIQGELVAAPFTVYSQRREGLELSLYSGSVIIHQLILCAASVVGVALVLALVAAGVAPAGLRSTLMVLLAAAPLLLMRCFIRHFLFAQFRFGQALSLDLLAAACQLSVLFLLARTGTLGAPNVFLVMGAACLMVCLVWSRTFTAPLLFQSDRIWRDWKDNWSFARWALPSQLIGCSTPYVMPWVLQAGHGAGATGAYAVCTTLIGLSHMFVCGVSNVLTPKATRSHHDGGAEALRRVLWKAALVLAAPLMTISLLLAISGDALPVMIFGDKFAGLGSICLLLSIAATINSLAVVGGNGLWALDQPKVNLWGDGATFLGTVVAAILLVYPYGLWGAALSTLVGVSLGTIVRCFTLVRCLRLAAEREALRED